jgi:hypothetical protein
MVVHTVSPLPAPVGQQSIVSEPPPPAPLEPEEAPPAPPASPLLLLELTEEAPPAPTPVLVELPEGEALSAPAGVSTPPVPPAGVDEQPPVPTAKHAAAKARAIIGMLLRPTSIAKCGLRADMPRRAFVRIPTLRP